MGGWGVGGLGGRLAHNAVSREANLACSRLEDLTDRAGNGRVLTLDNEKSRSVSESAGKTTWTREEPKIRDFPCPKRKDMVNP